MFYSCLKIFDKTLWADNISDAKVIQENLKKKIKICPLDKSPSIIAGVDAAFFQDKVIAVAAFYSYPELSHIEDSYAIEKANFPYIPGFLSFREGHSIVAALCKSKIKSDLIIFDGQGIAHPRGVGIASHLGVLLNIPSIGCAKSRLVGEYEEPDTKKASTSPLLYNGKQVGIVMRTRTNIKPVFISPGHLIDIDSSLKIVMNCVLNFRMPEPLRRADRLSKQLKGEI